MKYSTAPQKISNLIMQSSIGLALVSCFFLGSCTASEDKKPAAPAAALTGEALEGSKLFAKLACATCHQATRTQLAPTLRGVYGSKVKLASGETVTVDDAYIKESILNPKAKIVAGFQPLMPPQKVDDKQIASLIAYIKTLAAPQPKK